MLCCAKLFCLFFLRVVKARQRYSRRFDRNPSCAAKALRWMTYEVTRGEAKLIFHIYIYIIFFPACYPGKPGKLPKRDVEKLLWQKCHRSPESQNCSAQGKKTQSHPITNPSPSHPSAISIGQRELRCCQVLCTSPSAMSPTVVECMQLPPQSCGGQPL